MIAVQVTPPNLAFKIQEETKKLWAKTI